MPRPVPMKKRAVGPPTSRTSWRQRRGGEQQADTPPALSRAIPWSRMQLPVLQGRRPRGSRRRRTSRCLKSTGCWAWRGGRKGGYWRTMPWRTQQARLLTAPRWIVTAHNFHDLILFFRGERFILFLCVARKDHSFECNPKQERWKPGHCGSGKLNNQSTICFSLKFFCPEFNWTPPLHVAGGWCCKWVWFRREGKWMHGAEEERALFGPFVHDRLHSLKILWNSIKKKKGEMEFIDDDNPSTGKKKLVCEGWWSSCIFSRRLILLDRRKSSLWWKNRETKLEEKYKRCI